MKSKPLICSLYSKAPINRSKSLICFLGMSLKSRFGEADGKVDTESPRAWAGPCEVGLSVVAKER
jgi:hypothetical protein